MVFSCWWLVRSGLRVWKAYAIVSCCYVLLTLVFSQAGSYPSLYLIAFGRLAFEEASGVQTNHGVGLVQAGLVELVALVAIPTLLLFSLSRLRDSLR